MRQLKITALKNDTTLKYGSNEDKLWCLINTQKSHKMSGMLLYVQSFYKSAYSCELASSAVNIR